MADTWTIIAHGSSADINAIEGKLGELLVQCSWHCDVVIKDGVGISRSWFKGSEWTWALGWWTVIGEHRHCVPTLLHFKSVCPTSRTSLPLHPTIPFHLQQLLPTIHTPTIMPLNTTCPLSLHTNTIQRGWPHDKEDKCHPTPGKVFAVKALAWGFGKPEPPQAKPKPGLSGQAGPEQH